MTKAGTLLTCLVLTLAANVGIARAQNATTASTAQVSSTIYSIGIEWQITGDANHDATAAVRYRPAGTATWKPALPLVRVQNATANTLAGSILFLSAGTTYEINVTLADPDGGGETRTLTASTRPLPVPPAGGRMFHVVPGTSGGDGSAANPFRGVAAAQGVAGPGDTFVLHAGSYGGRIRFERSGAPGSYIAWRAAGDGEVLMDGIDVSGSHVWFEGLTVRRQAYALMAAANPDDVVVSFCRFYDNHRAIYLEEGGRNWYIADNTIVGDTPYATESLDGEGIDLNITGGHTVAHNTISSVADGISYPGGNVDIFGNDIFDTSDDGIEADYGGANVRMWRNRIHNAVHNGISFQPQSGAPWYIVRNQVVGNVEAAFKFRTTDRFVLLHNTIVNWGTAWPGDAMMCCNEDHLLRAIARNNLWISIQGGQIWGFDAGVIDWRTDLDYDGVDWGAALNPFVYGGVTYPDLASLAAGSGLEPHGVRVSRATCFQTFNVPTAPPSPVPAQVMTLKSGCAAVDAGAALANVDDGEVVGAAPDLGAYEYGRPAPAFGPRGAPTPPTPPTPPSGGSTPFSGTPVALPGTLQAENFDNGGAEVAYHDASAGNSGGAYRTTDVDIEGTSDTGGGYDVGWVSAGEWLKYTVAVATAGTYTVEVRVASPGSGGTFHIEANGVDKTGPMTVPNTGGWQAWTTVTRTGVSLAAGTQVLRVVMDSASPGGAVGNFNWIRVSAAAPSGSTPYTGTAVALPGTVQAENFDNGGAEVAYHDGSAGNNGGAYRTTDVDIEPTTDAGAGYDVGWVSPGEWLKYSVAVATAGTYTIEVRVASTSAGATFHIEANGVDKTGPMTVPNTGGWQAWTTVTRTGVSLAAGTQVLRVVMDSASPGGAVGNFNWVRVSAAAPSGSTPYTGTAVALPGTVQAENFDNGGAEVAYHDGSAGNNGGAYRTTDVDIEPTTDAGGGYDVGWVSPGEWLKYSVAVATAGTYTVEVRVASTSAGATFHLEANGVDKTGPMTVPNTGGWQAWTTITRTGVSLAAGTQVLRLVVDAAGNGGVVGNFNWIRVSAAAPSGSTPYTGSPVALPGTVQAENFDNGGAEVAYHDASSGNSGGVYRSTGVDIEPTTDAGGGYDVGWVSAGEWLKYSVAVATAGTYTVEVRVASTSAGATFHLEANGVDKTGPMTVPNTGGWQAWTTVTRTGVSLAAGTQVLRLVVDTAGSGGVVGNFNWIRVSAPAPSGSTPYTGTPVALPGTVQAENFDNGGAEVAYHDASTGNSGGAYRSTGVDIEATSDAGGGYNLGWVSGGEWLKYTVSVASAGTYTLEVRVASPAAGGTFHVEADGVDKTGPIAVPNTGGWQAWTTVSRAGVTLAAGTQVLRVVMDTAAANGAVGNFNWLRVSQAP